MHDAPHPFAGKTVRIRKEVKHPQFPNFGGSEFLLEDWWDRVAGKSWMHCDGNPACLVYAMRTSGKKVPIDDEVVYGKMRSYGHLVHVSEIEFPSGIIPSA
jgi:hypothetical protein